MKIDIMTLFPEMINAVMRESIIGRAQDKGLVEVKATNIRDYALDKHHKADDAPYGGGRGQVMLAEPLYLCHEALSGGEHVHTVFLSAQGAPFNQEKARELLAKEHFILVCGHYEGIDQRFIDECVDEEISIGDFVLTGGEIPAMAVADAVCRMVPGVLSDTECYTGESHWAGRLEYPQYTRPETWEGRTVPEVLRGGNHAEITAWRTRQSLERTLVKRPELFRETPPTPDEQRLLDKIRRDRSRPQLVEPPVCRPAAEDDLPAILAIVQQARNYLRRHRVDQWQGAYPNEGTFRADIAAGTCHVLTYQGAVAAMFTLTFTPEPAYDALTDGRWRSDRDHAAVLHRNAVAADWRGTGMADHLMQAAEQLARESGAHAVRVDTHRHNGAQKKLLERHGYRFCGNILCDEPGHDPRRQAFEKLLK